MTTYRVATKVEDLEGWRLIGMQASADQPTRFDVFKTLHDGRIEIDRFITHDAKLAKAILHQMTEIIEMKDDQGKIIFQRRAFR